ncbi:MAG TPA: hypothetical protein VGN16_23605 [Acidobacteriaceae bacterium]|jgi:hypothetical protein
MEMTDEDIRYITYRQSQLLDEDWKSIFDPAKWRAWAEQNIEQFRALIEQSSTVGRSSIIGHLEDFLSFGPDTVYELPTSRAIFAPIFEEVEMAAERIGLKPIRVVRLFTSTGIDASPSAFPTSADHMLFVGLGTSSFCNYWAKCITVLIMAIHPSIGMRRMEKAEDVESVFRNAPHGLLLATRLVLYYATFGTVIGFGEVKQPPECLAYRVQLLDAMETFAIAHEYAHFVAEERLPEFSGVLDSAQSQKLELFCDRLGLSISRESGSVVDNYLTFAGVGALVTFRVMQMCDTARKLIGESFRPISGITGSDRSTSSHPEYEDRIQLLKGTLCENTALDQRDQLESIVEEYDFILCMIAKTVISALATALERAHSGSLT